MVQKLLPKVNLRMDMSVSWVFPTADDYAIRCGGCNEYIFDLRAPLSAIMYVRDCIAKTRAIEFDLIEYEPLSNKVINRVPHLNIYH